MKIEMSQLEKETEVFLSNCLKLKSVDTFTQGLESVFNTENKVEETIEALEKENDLGTMIEEKKALESWQEKYKEYLNACRIIYQELKRMERDYIFVIDYRDIILLIKAIATYMELKNRLDFQKDIQEQIMQLHSLQEKINKKFQSVFPNSNVQLLSEELPRMMENEEDLSRYQTYVEEFYQKPEKVTIDELMQEVEVNVPESKPERQEELSQPIEIPEFSQEKILEQLKDITSSSPVIVEPTEEEKTQQFIETVKEHQENSQETKEDITIEKRRENYDSYIKFLYNEMDKFENNRQKMIQTSTLGEVVTDYLQNQYNKSAQLQNIIVSEIQRVVALESSIKDPEINLNIPNKDMPGETIIEYLQNKIPFDYYAMPGKKPILLPDNMEKEKMPLVSTSETLEEEPPRNFYNIEFADISAYPFYAEMHLHENARLWGMKGSFEGTPIPPKYPQDATRYSLAYSVMMPDNTFQLANSPEQLKDLLFGSGKVMAVRTFDGFYDLNDISFEETNILKH